METRSNRIVGKSLSRRTLAAGLALGLGLGATPTKRGFAQGATPISSPVVGGFPVTVEHVYGPTTIPAPPTRIVSVDLDENVDSLLAIDVQPVFYGYAGGYIDAVPTWVTEAGLDAAIPHAPMFGAEPDVERIAAARPDLILTSWTPEDGYRQLSGIAPTVVSRVSLAGTWQETQRLVGAATGRDTAAATAIAATDAAIADQRQRLTPYASRSIAVAYPYFDTFYVHGETASVGRLLREFGFAPFSPPPDTVDGLSSFSMENMGVAADADILISLDFRGTDIASQEANPLFRSLPAVQNGGYVVLPIEQTQALHYESTLSIRWVAPRLGDAIIAAAEGRGKRPGA